MGGTHGTHGKAEILMKKLSKTFMGVAVREK
jgi:hypothetical protein